MKRNRLTYYSAIAIIAITFLTCKKENKIQPGSGNGNGSVSGLIIDLNDMPVSNATVAGGTATTTTDANGKFTLSNVQFTADSVLVNVTKDGFFEGSKKFASTGSTVTDAKIRLILKSAAATITASSGGSVAVAGGGSVDFTSGFVNASNGNAYTGNVSVATFYLNPADPGFSASAPGDLKAAGAATPQGSLHSFGVIAVELNDGSGNKVQLAAGKTATISIPIPASLLGNAPSNIPLWYFDDTKGAWKPEGTAIKQGNNYTGTVNHFTFWSAGDLIQFINLTARFTLDTTGIAYANKRVTVSRTDSSSTEDYTDNTGTVTGLVPANEILTLKVFNNCNDNVYTKNIGPFSTNTDLGNIMIMADPCISSDTSQYLWLTINGKKYSWPGTHLWESYQPGTSTFIMGNNTQITPDSSIVFEGTIFTANTSQGDYSMAILITINGVYTYQAGGMSYDPSYPYPITSVTKYDAVGGYIEGDIGGTIKTFPSTATADSFVLAGSYRVKRTQ